MAIIQDLVKFYTQGKKPEDVKNVRASEAKAREAQVLELKMVVVSVMGRSQAFGDFPCALHRTSPHDMFG